MLQKKSFLIKFPTHNYSNLGLLKFNIFVIIPRWVKLRFAKMAGSLHIPICKILIFDILYLSNLLVSRIDQKLIVKYIV